VVEVGYIDVEIERVAEEIDVGKLGMILPECCVLCAQELLHQVLLIGEVVEQNSLHHVIPNLLDLQSHQRAVYNLNPQSIQS